MSMTEFISILKIDTVYILSLMSSVIAVVFKVYDLDVSMSLWQLLSFIRELVITDIKDSSAEHDFNSSRLSQQIDNVSEHNYIIWQLTLTKDLMLNSINQSLETDIKDLLTKVNLDEKLIYQDKMIYYNKKLYISVFLHDNIIAKYYDNSLADYFNYNKTLELLMRKYLWLCIASEVKECVETYAIYR